MEFNLCRLAELFSAGIYGLTAKYEIRFTEPLAKVAQLNNTTSFRNVCRADLRSESLFGRVKPALVVEARGVLEPWAMQNPRPLAGGFAIGRTQL